MRRGTTPTIEIGLDDFDVSLISEVIVTVRQREVVINKTPEIEDNVLRVVLTQEDTLSLDSTSSCRIQAKIKLTDGNVVATDIAKIPVSDILNEVVI